MPHRTRLLAGIVAVLLLTGAAGAVIAGRSGSSSDSDRRRRPAESGRPAVAPEGALRVGVPELPPTLDPFDLRSRTPAASAVLRTVLPQLFDVAPDGRVQGRLVEPGSVEVGRRAVRFRLRQGARWSDGRPLTADDLRFTLDVVRGDVWPGPVAGYDEVSTIEGRGREVTLRFARSTPQGWPRLFSGDDYVLPRHRLSGTDLATVWDTGPGVAGGPYRLAGSTPGLDVVLEANPEWWGDGPGVASIRMLVVPDPTTMDQLFLRHELDVIEVPAFTERHLDVEEYRDATVAVSTAEPGGTLVSLVAETTGVDRPARSEAFSLLDRDRFASVLLRDEAERATSWFPRRHDGPWARWSADRRPALSGRSESLTIVSSTEDAMSALVSRAMQEQAKDTKVELEDVRVDAELLDGDWLPSGTFDLALVDEVQWPDPCARCRFGSEAVGESNWPRVSSVDDLARDADLGADGAVGLLESRLRSDAVLLPLWRPSAVAVSRGVSGVQANSWHPGPLWRAERWSVTAGK